MSKFKQQDVTHFYAKGAQKLELHSGTGTGKIYCIAGRVLKTATVRVYGYGFYWYGYFFHYGYGYGYFFSKISNSTRNII
ncbi:MAG: hypothetical protein GY820_27020 [Gammaproteobacteria bacterium]|nr:hypothetical protein [Gammaproteobacteria bacterium]